MNSVAKLMMISFLTQCYLLDDANGKSSNVGTYGVVAKLRKDMKLAQQFENNPIDPDEKWINDGKISEVAIYLEEFSIVLKITLISNTKLYLTIDHYCDFR